MMVSCQHHAPAALHLGPVWMIWCGEQSTAPAGVQTRNRHFIAQTLCRKLRLDIGAVCPQSVYVYMKMVVPLDNTN
jgi:hypothetical protein